MIGKGIFEFEIEGQKIGFKFGMYAAAVTEKISGCSIMELFQRIHGAKILYNEKGEVTGRELLPGMATISLLQYFYGGAVAYNKNDQLTLDEVGDYLDLIGEEKAFLTFSQSVQTYLPKKKPAQEVKKKAALKSGQ
jgi:hypothetical protein